MTFLSVENLVVRHGRQDVLRSISLQVERGSLVALLGSSGCGKTTLLRTISGFNPVAAGRITLDGRDITALPPERRGTAMVFQSYALWPHMTVAQNIGYGLKLRGVAKADIAARVESLLTLLHLPDLAQRNVTQLSGGQRQRVALGRALAIDPGVLLLDEPLSNLDAHIRVELRHEIRAVQQRLGITALHVTHDREEAMVIADRVVVLRDGKIAQEGTPHEVYHRPQTPFVANFMGADNVVRVVGSGTAASLTLRAGDGPECTLPLGETGAHLVGDAHTGKFDAHFRAAAAHLLPAGRPADSGCLVLAGRVLQASYPGDVWRYTIKVGDRSFLIDDPVALGPGAETRVAIPAAALHLFVTGSSIDTPLTQSAALAPA
jgi:putative spermidine/putrescine transport system ATP-binding protein